MSGHRQPASPALGRPRGSALVSNRAPGLPAPQGDGSSLEAPSADASLAAQALRSVGMQAPGAGADLGALLSAADYSTPLSEQPAVWQEVLREGAAHSHYTDGRTVVITAQTIIDLAETYSEHVLAESWYPRGCAIDVNHRAAWEYPEDLSVEGRAALGRVEALRYRQGPDGRLVLDALTRMRPIGYQLIDSGAYAGWSSEIIWAEYAQSKATGQPIGRSVFTGLTLCNDPMVPGLAPARSPDRNPEHVDAAAVALSASATNRRGATMAQPAAPTPTPETLSGRDVLQRLSARLDCGATEPKIYAALAALEGRASEAEAEARRLSEQLSARDTEIEAMRSQVEAARAARADITWSEGLAAGRWQPAQEGLVRKLILSGDWTSEELATAFPAGTHKRAAKGEDLAERPGEGVDHTEDMTPGQRLHRHMYSAAAKRRGVSVEQAEADFLSSGRQYGPDTCTRQELDAALAATQRSR